MIKMIKTWLLIILNLSLLSNISSQIIDCEWEKNEPIEDQIIKFKNGKIWIKNLLVNDTLWRYEFTTSGELKLKTQIIQLIYGDTLRQLNEDTYEEYVYVTLFKKDTPDGKFIRYFDNQKIEEKGAYLKGKKIGEWKEYFISGQLKRILNYNDNGKKKGNYKEYYSNGNVKVIGQYQIEKIAKRKTWFDPEIYEVLNKKIFYECEIKKGKWQYFSKKGELKDEIEFE